MQGVVFATVGGMRGAVSLILAQTVLTLEASAFLPHDTSLSGGRGPSKEGRVSDVRNGGEH